MEPLPDRDHRRAILLYEAAEGGAGVLTRLVSDPDALVRVARRALRLCHYESVSGEWLGPKDLYNKDNECEAGCYRCLLSYYNQLDHPAIDRRDPVMCDILCRLIRGTRSRFLSVGADSVEEMKNISVSSLEKTWLDYIQDNGFRRPDKAQPYLDEFQTRPDFAYTAHQTLIYIDGPHHHQSRQRVIDAAVTERLHDAGFTVIRFGASPASWSRIIDDYTWVFGPGLSSPPDQDIGDRT